MKKLILFLVPVFFLCGCKTSVAPDDKIYVNIEAVKLSEIKDVKTFSGFIDRGLDVDLSFGSSGIVKEFYTREGEFVKKGKLLATLDNEEYKLNVEKAKSELEDAVVKYERAKSYFERISKLHQAGGISYNDWESAQTNLKSSVNQINILKDALGVAKNKERFTQIFAPYDGYVIKIVKDRGQYAFAGDTAINFQGKGNLEARIFVSQREINNLNRGQKVIIKTEAYPEKKYDGIIKSKVNSSIKDGSYRLTVYFPADYDELLDGMSVSMEINDKIQKNGFFIPQSAVIYESGQSFIFLVEKKDDKKGIIRKRKVETGEIYKDKILITKGIKEGDFAVVEGAGRVVQSMEVFYYE